MLQLWPAPVSVRGRSARRDRPCQIDWYVSEQLKQHIKHQSGHRICPLHPKVSLVSVNITSALTLSLSLFLAVFFPPSLNRHPVHPSVHCYKCTVATLSGRKSPNPPSLLPPPLSPPIHQQRVREGAGQRQRARARWSCNLLVKIPHTQGRPSRPVPNCAVSPGGLAEESRDPFPPEMPSLPNDGGECDL